MPTNIDQCTDLLVSTPHNDGRLIANLDSEEVAYLRDLGDMTGADPMSQHNAPHLELEELGVRIKPLAESTAGAVG
jgi:hypothetical protein